MMPEHSVITHATRGHVEQLAAIREVTPRRMYEQLGDQCCYTKTKLLIRDIATVNPEGARLIKADLDAMFAQILGSDALPIDAAELHKELNDPVQAKLRDDYISKRLFECRQARAALDREINALEYAVISK
jgi:hypothetical protein